MARRLSDADRELWERLKRTVTPLRRRKAAKLADHADDQTAKPSKPAPRKKDAEPVGPASAPPPKLKPVASPPLAPLEDKTLRRLGRGQVEVDARIDLHGMRQDRADAALAAFLRGAQARGDRIVLVVTGKGSADREGRGVLRQVVPGWLTRPGLRELVVGFQEAGRRHGGEGALYVRIRRRRAARPRSSAAR